MDFPCHPTVKNVNLILEAILQPLIPNDNISTIKRKALAKKFLDKYVKYDYPFVAEEIKGHG